MIIAKGTKVNPDKILAIQEMSPPVSLNEVHKLAGCLTALNRFISHSADRRLPFFKALRRTRNFASDGHASRLSRTCRPTWPSYRLTKPSSSEPLYLYLDMGQHAASSVLQDGEGSQRPIYYLSKV
ncbi:UNVERIFIED_CONTAM: hypothetical protein Slati_0153600 [Sesamum latifolium]|uniref:Reverse transcriptase/retrotransposon-derived protein RNase H-like domain-containing protein n=1 Tax=Sesamum latifolium TaxID=2727402 RepID=A0AAW2YB27_9LAMI